MDKNSLVKVVEMLILHYVKGKYSDRSNIEEEISRIQEICNSLDVSFENRKRGFGGIAANLGDGKIIICFYDKDNPTEDELIQVLGVLIHEVYHSISKYEKENIFLDEGYVTYITAETIRYAIDNPIEIPGVITKERLKKMLEKQSLINGYNQPSEIVRSIQLVMQQHGVDSTYVYMFEGLSALEEISVRISPELERILKLQEYKPPLSRTLNLEVKFFEKAFEQIDYLDISPTLIEMNRLLQIYLVKSGEIDRNRRVYDLINKFNHEYIAYIEFCKRGKDLSDEELVRWIHSELPQQPIEYQVHENEDKIILQIDDIKGKYKESKLPVMFDEWNFYIILVAYDLLQKGMENPTEEDIRKYFDYIIFNFNDIKIIIFQILKYMEYLRIECEKGKDLKDILNETLINSAIFLINLQRIKDRDLPFWNKVNEATELIMNQPSDKLGFCFMLYFDVLSKMYKQSIDINRIYNEDDYDDFVERMRNAFGRAQIPDVIMEAGYTPESIFIKTISENLDFDSESFPVQVINLLKIVNSRNPNLGMVTGRFNELGLGIRMSYEALQKAKDAEMLRMFEESLIIACYSQSYNSSFLKVMCELYDSIVYANKNIEVTLKSIITNPDFYSDLESLGNMFEQYPNVAQAIMENEDVKKMLITQLPDGVKKLLDNQIVSIGDIERAVFWFHLKKLFPKERDYNSEKFKKLSPLVQFFLQYYRYQQNLESGKKHKFLPIFMGFGISGKKVAVLDNGTVETMAKKPDVQSCQVKAHDVLAVIDYSEMNHRREEKEKL